MTEQDTLLRNIADLMKEFRVKQNSQKLLKAAPKTAYQKGLEARECALQHIQEQAEHDDVNISFCNEGMCTCLDLNVFFV